jgi:formate--tetrahydrofolate ligase
MPSDLEIAQAVKMKPITEIATRMGLDPDEDIELYGKYKAKIKLETLKKPEFIKRPTAKYINVTAITPTPLGEGKTTTTVGLGQALNYTGRNAIITIRQPSLGPVFGIKGGAAGGGYSQVVPMEDFNLHLTGDVHAIGAANNLLAAFIENHFHHGNKLNIDPHSVTWRRAVDISDRSLREIVLGLGGKENGIPRESGFDITVASEVMAILALTTGLQDLRQRLGRIVIGQSRDGRAITAEDLKCAGAMTVLLRDAIKPNILQTLEGNPALVHCGPFANIAHGNSSILADMIAVKCADYVITESGFGADMGSEKFFNIKCRISGITPDASVLVATIRAIKMHSGRFKVVAGKPLDAGLLEENLEAVRDGVSNLIKQIENVRIFGVPVVVALNYFPTDTEAEIEIVREAALAAGADDCVVSKIWADGGKGGVALADAVAKAADKGGNYKPLYELDEPIETKIERVATQIYGADGIEVLPAAAKKIRLYNKLGYNNLPVCLAKTHLSLSHDPNLKGRPSGFTVPVRDINLSAGAGFLYALLGQIVTMPGLPSVPAGENIDIDADGNVLGLF